jgi:hypothetical protein
MTTQTLLPLDLPAEATKWERGAWRRLCQHLAEHDPTQAVGFARNDVLAAAGIRDLFPHPVLAAAAHTAIDLVDQGWSVTVDRRGPLFSPPEPNADLGIEKTRIRNQELVRRDEQLRSPSVSRFVRDMERRRIFQGRAVSIFDLMRDGRDLLQALDADREKQAPTAITPYVQVADDSYCEQTGLRLLDIWRYFRHTWSNAYASVPGRTMPLLIRDASAPSHPVIGLAALASPVVQIAERDNWIGWATDAFLDELCEHPTLKSARWVGRRLTAQIRSIYIDDLMAEGILRPSDLTSPSPEAVARLRADAERHRRLHHRFGRVRKVRNIPVDAWVDRAETHLFRSKRSAALAEALDCVAVLGPFFRPRPSVRGLQRALDNPLARRQLRRLVRRARGERVGTIVADLSVCGAVPPYNALVAGKLVAACAVSPPVLEEYRRRYSRASEIASAMAGRPVVRDSRLAFVGTTSLYGTGSSQYNRLFWPAELWGGPSGARLGFHRIGKSRSFGTSHFSDDSVTALLRLAELHGTTVRVNSLFGEGVSPRLRKVRIGLATLGWPANELLQHGRFRLVYGISLIENLRDFALGIDTSPEYVLDASDDADAVGRLGAWWMTRWALPRVQRPEVRAAIAANTLSRPIRHGARVPTVTSIDDRSAPQLPLVETDS